MSWEKDHLITVATRRAKNLKKIGEDKERKILKRYGWSDSEIDEIIKIENRTRSVISGQE